LSTAVPRAIWAWAISFGLVDAPGRSDMPGRGDMPEEELLAALER
jgi:hypothetical protein